jgi:hypothetical protein
VHGIVAVRTLHAAALPGKPCTASSPCSGGGPGAG